jgi:hypothetical protein
MTENKYQKAIIYMITSGTDKYIGSTCNYTRRKCEHKRRIEFKDTEKNCNTKLYKKIRENNEWLMAPIKKYPCDSKFELELEEERFRIEFKANLNSYQCHGRDPEAHRRAQKKYVEKHHDRVLESQRKYNEKNREKIKENGKEYREKHHDRVLENKRKYREKNKEKNSQKITCPHCSCIVRRDNLTRHKRTKKCLKAQKEQIV